MRWRKTIVAAATLAGISGCTFNLDLRPETLFPTGTSFVLRGTSDIVEAAEGACLVWIGENGVTYHLFQNARIPNDEFDQITTPGVTSRLEVATRSDLIVDCQLGTVVEVQTVLEIVP